MFDIDVFLKIYDSRRDKEIKQRLKQEVNYLDGISNILLSVLILSVVFYFFGEKLISNTVAEFNLTGIVLLGLLSSIVGNLGQIELILGITMLISIVLLVESYVLQIILGIFGKNSSQEKILFILSIIIGGLSIAYAISMVIGAVFGISVFIGLVLAFGIYSIHLFYRIMRMYVELDGFSMIIVIMVYLLPWILIFV